MCDSANNKHFISVECDGKATKNCLVNVVLAGHMVGHLIVGDRKLTSNTPDTAIDWSYTHNSGHYGGRRTVVICKDFYCTSSGTMLDVVFVTTIMFFSSLTWRCDGPRYSSEVSNILLTVEKASFKQLLLWLNTIRHISID